MKRLRGSVNAPFAEGFYFMEKSPVAGRKVSGGWSAETAALASDGL